MTETQEQTVRNVLARVMHCLDGRRYPELRKLYADEVEVDYTSLFGGEIQKVPGDALIAGWRERLGKLSATQHMLGPIDVEIAGQRARAECHVRGYHYRKGFANWLVAGHYRIELAQVAGAWVIVKHALDAYAEEGSRDLLG